MRLRCAAIARCNRPPLAADRLTVLTETTDGCLLVIRGGAGVSSPLGGVTEVWEAEENWDSWYQGTIKPNLPDGIEPRVTTRELNNVVQP